MEEREMIQIIRHEQNKRELNRTCGKKKKKIFRPLILLRNVFLFFLLLGGLLNSENLISALMVKMETLTAYMETGQAASLIGTDFQTHGSAKDTAVLVNETFDWDQIDSRNILLLDRSSGEVLYEREAGSWMYPASMTKMMTVFVALENAPDLRETVYLHEEMYSGLYTAHASLAGFKPKEEVPLTDLLYGSMLPSGAEASIGLAEHLFGSEEGFVREMNRKAAELGMAGTSFVNVTGLHRNNHYTTATDLALFLDLALEHELFRQIFTSSSYTAKSTERRPEDLLLRSTLFSRMEDGAFEGGRILGGKTGYTEEAGQCLATLAEKNGREFILITAGASGSPYGEQKHIEDALKIYDGYLQ